jgi:hypothetical protein
VGEIKSLALAISGFLWVHFDVIALATTEDTSGGGGGGGPKPKTQLVSNLSTDLVGNPGSHDVTWKNPGDKPPEGNVPEPSALWLLGLGLLGCASFARKAEKSVS